MLYFEATFWPPFPIGYIILVDKIPFTVAYFG